MIAPEVPKLFFERTRSRGIVERRGPYLGQWPQPEQRETANFLLAWIVALELPN
jgi:hypothetical protein